LGTNQKRICDFLLVHNKNFGPILHRFGGFAAYTCSYCYSTPILWVFPLHQTTNVGVNVSK